MLRSLGKKVRKLKNDSRGFIGDMLVGLAVALGIFMVVVIIIGILMAQSYVAGQAVANQVNDTATRTTLTTTWAQIFTLYGYFGTWSPIIFITVFGGIAILAIYTFVAGRRERGGEGGAI
jgi:flagellar biosynthesis protein FlhB